MADEGDKDDTRSVNARESDDAWGALSLIISGIALYGGVGALVGWWVGSPLPIVIGMVLGMAGAMYLVWVRYGRA